MENFSKSKLNKKLNKGISAPIGILIVALCFVAAITGIFVYYNLADDEMEKLQENKELSDTDTSAGAQNEVPENDNEISIKDLENAEYYISESIGKVKLENGSYFKRWQPDSATGLSIWIEKEQIAFGDLNNDGKDDAAVIIYISGGGSSIDTELAIMLNKQGEPIYHTSLPLKCKEEIHSADIESDLTGLNIIVVDMTTQGPDDFVCHPSNRKVVKYKLLKKELVEVEKEISDEKSYFDKDAKFILNYPSYVSLEDGDSNLVLSISKEKIDLLDGPMGYDKETAIKDRQALNKGQYGELIDWPLEESKQVIKLKNGEYGKSFMVLSRFEVCDVTFERIFMFYSNDYQIVINLSYTAIDEIRNSMSKYFKIDGRDCGTEMIWRGIEDKEKFYQSLANNNGSHATQRWHDTFDDIIESIDNSSELFY